MTAQKAPNKSLRQADVIVIGAGISGLVAAALLSKQGLKVIVCERDIHPGGCAASFEKEGYRFAVGATVAMGLEPGGLVRQIYNELGLSPNYVEVNPAIRVYLEDRVADVKTKPHEWQQELKKIFPKQEKAKTKFWQEMTNLAAAMYHASNRFPVMPIKHINDLLDTAKAAHPKLLPLLPKLNKTIKDRLEHYQIDDPIHKAFIDGQLIDAMQTSSDHCVATSGAFALDIYRYGCQYKTGGLSSVAQDLADYITQRGGEIAYATRVKEIMSENKSIKGVSTNQGEIHAKLLISAIPLSNTSDLLKPDQAKQLTKRANNQAEMWGAFTLYMGVDESALTEKNGYYSQVTETENYHDGGNLLISISPDWDITRAPQGKRAITVSTHVNAQHWLELAQNKEAYEKAKQQLEEKLLCQIERVHPNIRKGIEYFKSGSPRTFKQFTLRDGGTVGGFPQTLKDANFNAPSHRTDIKGLFLAGDTIFPGQGILGASVSGFNAARSAKRASKRLKT